MWFISKEFLNTLSVIPFNVFFYLLFSSSRFFIPIFLKCSSFSWENQFSIGLFSQHTPFLDILTLYPFFSIYFLYAVWRYTEPWSEWIIPLWFGTFLKDSVINFVLFLLDILYNLHQLRVYRKFCWM